jgi:hypothetical protein
MSNYRRLPGRAGGPVCRECGSDGLSCRSGGSTGLRGFKRIAKFAGYSPSEDGSNDRAHDKDCVPQPPRFGIMGGNLTNWMYHDL